MDISSYFIQQQIFDLEFSSREKAQELQNRVSRICNEELFEKLEMLFKRLLPDDVLLKLDELVIDAGTVSLANLERDFTGVVLEAIEAELLRLLLKGSDLRRRSLTEFIGSQADHLTILLYFLTRGIIPLWAQSSTSANINKVAAVVLQEKPRQYADQLYRLGDNAKIHQRLSHQFDDTVIEGTIGVLQPGDAPFIIAYHGYAIQSTAQENLIPGQLTSFRYALWEIIFRILLTEQSGRFNRKMFIRSTLVSMASHFNKSYHEILTILNSEETVFMLTYQNQEMIAIIAELWKEKSIDTTEYPEYNTKKLFRPDLHDNVDLSVPGLTLLYHYLSFKSLPSGMRQLSKNDLVSIFVRLLEKIPVKVTEGLRDWNYLPDFGSRVTDAYTITNTPLLIKFLEPLHADEIIAYERTVLSALQREQPGGMEKDAMEFSIWAIILDYLLIETGSDFNTKRFLETTIKRTANHFNIDLTGFLHTLLKSISAIKNLFRLVLYKETIMEMLENEPDNNPENTKVFALPGQSVKEYQKYLDLLYFWLENDHMPWWASGDLLPVSMLFQFTAENSFAHVSAFIAHAGTQNVWRSRVISNVPESQLLLVFKNLVGGSYALSIYISWQLLISSIRKTADSAKDDYSRWLLSVFWTFFASGNYQSFDAQGFIEILIYNLANTLKLTTTGTYRKLIHHSSGNKKFKLITDLLKMLSPASVRTYGQRLSSEEDLIDELSVTYFSDEESLISDKSEIYARRYFELLSFFIEYNRLPERMNVSLANVDNILLRMLTALHSVRPDLISELFNKQGLQRQRFHLFNVITRDGGAAAIDIRRSAEPYIEKDIITFLEQLLQQKLPRERWHDRFWEQIYSEEDGQRTSKILSKLFKEPAFAFHVAKNVKDRFFWAIIRNNRLHWGASMIVFLQETLSFFELAGDLTQNKNLGISVRQFNLMIFHAGYTHLSQAEYLRQLFKFMEGQFAALSPEVIQRLTQRLRRRVGFSAVTLAVMPQVSQFISRFSPQSMSEERKTEKILLSPYPKSLSGQDDIVSVAPETQVLFAGSEQDSLESGDMFFIDNAGLVLLHPFLTTFFDRLHMLEKGEFKSPEMQDRAVHLVQYLVNGKTDCSEQQLLLNKLLIGLIPETTVLPEITMLEEEIAVANQLLYAVTQQWEKLKTGTIEGLQHAFLQRQGLLTFNGEIWNLHVEPRAYDLLLQTLPWGISFIKLSWMKQEITVEWEV